MNNQNRIEKLPYPVENKKTVCNVYDDSRFKDPRIIQNTAHVDFNEKNS